MTIKRKPNGKEMTTGAGVEVIAAIRMGDPKTDPRKPGKEHDYLRVDWNRRNPDVMRKLDLLQDRWLSLYGERPKTLRNVRFNRDAIDSIWHTRNEEYARTKADEPSLMAACDGETLYAYRDRQTGRLSREPQICLAPNCDCSSVGRLFFWLPDFFKATGLLGEFMLITHSTIAIQEITGTLEMAEDLSTAAFGYSNIRRMAFDLHRVPQRINAPNGMTVTKNIAKLTIADAEAQRLAGEIQLALPSGTPAAPALPATTEAPAANNRTLIFEPKIYVFGPSPDDPAVRYSLKSGDKWYTTYDAELLQFAVPLTCRIVMLNHDEYVQLPVKHFIGLIDEDDALISLSGESLDSKGE